MYFKPAFFISNGGFKTSKEKVLIDLSTARSGYFVVHHGISVAIASTGCRGSAGGRAPFALLAGTLSAGGTNS